MNTRKMQNKRLNENKRACDEIVVDGYKGNAEEKKNRLRENKRACGEIRVNEYKENAEEKK